MLASLHIRNFRSLENFKVPKLGRVNLIVGKNNAGKSTVLEALRLYAGYANKYLLDSIAAEHDETVKVTAGDSDPLPYEALFTGRLFPKEDNQSIFIGEVDADANALAIAFAHLHEVREVVPDDEAGEMTRTVRKRIAQLELANLDADAVVYPALFISKGAYKQRVRFDRNERTISRTSAPETTYIPCSVVPTQFVTVEELATNWDKIVLKDGAAVVIRALQTIAPELVGLAFVENNLPGQGERRTREEVARYGIVRLTSMKDPVPLKSMGDGMVRILQLVLKAFSAQGGFLLIDEFENGLHYSIQEEVWNLLFELAEELDIQVFATTHSWDCIKSFAKVSVEKKNSDGVLFRLGKSVRKSDKGQLIATVFEEDQLDNITQADIEVR